MTEQVDLKVDIAWLAFTYPDGSKIFFRTTRNMDVLRSIPGGIVPGKLYDMDKLIWRDMPKAEGVVASLSKTRPIVSEVDEFANRFI